MANEPEQAIRSNIAVALGDLAVRHPNVMEPWEGRLYGHLRDGDIGVRRCVLMVLTHLILNDMVKVKGQLSEIALCLLDGDAKIASLARLFFGEFAKKGNGRTSVLENLLPDIMASLSKMSEAKETRCDADGFKAVLGFLCGFVGTGKNAEGMTEKLCGRFDHSDAEQHHRNVAFCLASLSHTEKSVRKLLEGQKKFATRLGDAEVSAHFGALVAKGRKFAKPELKAALDELEVLVRKATGESSADGEADADGAAATEADVAADGVAEGGEGEAAPAAEEPAAPAAPAPAAKKSSKKGGKAKKKKADSSEDEAEEEEEAPPAEEAPAPAAEAFEFDGENENATSNKAKKKAAAPKKKAAAAEEPAKPARGRSRRAAAA